MYPLLVVALVALLTVATASAQPQQSATPSPAESSAYFAAIHQVDPSVRASAIQQFLIAYPTSTLRQSAIAQMMLAKRQGNGAAAPPQGIVNRPMAPATAMAVPAVAAPPAAMPANTSFSAPSPTGPPRDSLLQKPAKPAVVSLAASKLTVKADNSALSQILHEISSSTGMTVDGLSKDERIFGTYGPGDPHEVLLALLQGSGYNVLMVGDANGVPRQLSLSDRAAASLASSAPVQRNNREEEEEEAEQEVQQTPPPEPPQPVNQPNAAPPAPDPTQPRSPAEMQQELLRRQQQLQQQQQQPQPQPQ